MNISPKFFLKFLQKKPVKSTQESKINFDILQVVTALSIIWFLKYFCTIDNLQKFLRNLHNGKTWPEQVLAFYILIPPNGKNYSTDQRNWHHFVSFHHQAYHPHQRSHFLSYPDLTNDAYLKMCVFYLIKLQLKRGIGRALKMKVGM